MNPTWSVFDTFTGMKSKKISKFLLEEILGEAIGYLAGLWAYFLVSSFFVERKIGNLWGLFSKKTKVSKDEFSWLTFIAAFIIGLTVMILVKRLVRHFTNPE